MSHFSKSSYKWAYKSLVLRDGECCRHCGAKPPFLKLEIDHIDDNPANDDFENLCLLCHKCNCFMRGKSTSQHKQLVQIHCAQSEGEGEEGKGYSASSAVSFTKDNIDTLAGSSEMQLNTIAEPRFRAWIVGELQKKVLLVKKDAINAGAEFVGCSPQTTARYLDKLTSSQGPLMEKKCSGQMVIKLKTISQQVDETVIL